jgi:hypothetical protein
LIPDTTGVIDTLIDAVPVRGAAYCTTGVIETGTVTVALAAFVPLTLGAISTGTVSCCVPLQTGVIVLSQTAVANAFF